MAALLVALLAAGSWRAYDWYVKGNRPSGLQATGTIEATQVELRAKLPGTLQNISLAAGDKVKKDQLIAVLDRKDLAAQKERDALGVLKARAQLDDLTSGARAEEIEAAQIAVDTARTNYEKAQKDYDRAKTLFQSKVIPDSDMEKADTALKQSINQLAAAKNQLSLLSAGSRPDQIAAAKAAAEQGAAVLKASESLLEDTKIICPLDGTVLSKNVEQGEYIQAGASVATVADLSDMWIKVYIPTDDLPKIRLGQQVKFTVSGDSAEYTGSVEEIAGQGEFTPKTIQTKKERANIVYAVKIKVNNENGILKPGMPADVTFN
jgi:HlyD family secretion protein